MSAAKKAAAQYRKTHAALLKLAETNDDDAQALALQEVKDYTLTFNKMQFIETEERERGILDALPDSTLQKDALIEKFEELRDF